MRILNVGRSIPSLHGNASEAVIARQLSRLARSGYQVGITVPGLLRNKLHTSSELEIVAPASRPLWWPPYRLTRNQTLWHTLLRTTCIQSARKFKPDAILGHVDGTHCEVSYAISQKLGKPACYFVHDALPDASLKPKRVDTILEKSAHCWCVTEELRQEVLRRGAPSASVLLPLASEWESDIDRYTSTFRGNVVISGSLYSLKHSFPTLLGILEKLNYQLTIVSSTRLPDWAEATRVSQIPLFETAEDCGNYLSRKADAFIIPYPMNELDYKNYRYYEHSFPSRLVEFARSGTPTLVISPDSFSISNWCHRFYPDGIANNFAAVEKWLGELQMPDHQKHLNKSILNLAETHFCNDRIDQQFQSELQQTCRFG